MSNGSVPGETPGSVAGGAADAGGVKPPGAEQDKSVEGQSPEELRIENARLRKLAANKAEEAKRHYEAREKLAEQYADIDLEEVKSLREEKARIEEDKARKNAEWDEHKAKLTKRAADAEKALEETRQSWTRERISNALLTAASGLGAVDADQVIAIYSGQFKEVDGKVLHVSAEDEDGNLLTPRGFLEREKAGKGANLFRTSMKGGSGQDGGGSAGDATGVVHFSLSKFKGRGLELSRLEEEARKAGKTVVIDD